LKKYVKANHTITVPDKMFDSLFNKALKSGVEKGVFEQPKGMSHHPCQLGLSWWQLIATFILT
jgi:hypothetical protein